MTHGRDVALRSIPSSLADGKWASLVDGKSLLGLNDERPGTWRVRDGVLVGEDDQGWSHLHTARPQGGAAAIRARIRLVRGDAVKLRLNQVGAKANEAIPARWNTFMSARAGGYIANEQVKMPVGKWVELVFLSREGNGKLYVDGWLALEGEGVLHAGDGVVGVGVSRGMAEIESLEILELR